MDLQKVSAVMDRFGSRCKNLDVHTSVRAPRCAGDGRLCSLPPWGSHPPGALVPCVESRPAHRGPAGERGARAQGGVPCRQLCPGPSTLGKCALGRVPERPGGDRGEPWAP